MKTEANRRAFIKTAGVAGVALITPAIASSATLTTGGSPSFRALLDNSDAIRNHFNRLPEDLEYADETRHEREMDRLADATRDADRAIPMNWREFTRLLEHMTDRGHCQIDDDNASRLLDHARRLVAKEA